MKMPSEVDQFRMLSVMSFKPVIFNDDMCFWCGIFMHKQVAFVVASSIFNKIQPSNAMKDSLWELQYDAVMKAKRIGCKFDFDLSDYQHDGNLVNYLSRTMGEKIHNVGVDVFCPDWFADPSKVFWFFVDKSITYESC
jgi:hypothetical protein